jgi:hypothetical protein
MFMSVPDPGSRDRVVILASAGLLGKPKRGVGNLGLGGDEKGEVSLRVTWDQGGRDRITPKEGFQVSKRERKESNGELARGVKTRGLRHNHVVNLYTCI